MWSFSDGRESNSAFTPGHLRRHGLRRHGVLTEAGRYLRSRILTGVGNQNG